MPLDGSRVLSQPNALALFSVRLLPRPVHPRDEVIVHRTEPRPTTLGTM